MFINKNFIKSIKTAAGTAAKAGCSGGVREIRGSKAGGEGGAKEDSREFRAESAEREFQSQTLSCFGFAGLAIS